MSGTVPEAIEFWKCLCKSFGNALLRELPFIKIQVSKVLQELSDDEELTPFLSNELEKELQVRKPNFSSFFDELLLLLVNMCTF